MSYCDVEIVLPVHVIGCSHLLIVDAVSHSEKKINNNHHHSILEAHHLSVASYIPDIGHCVQPITL